MCAGLTFTWEKARILTTKGVKCHMYRKYHKQPYKSHSFYTNMSALLFQLQKGP